MTDATTMILPSHHRSGFVAGRFLVESLLGVLPGAIVVLWWGFFMGVGVSSLQLGIFFLFLAYSALAAVGVVVRFRTVVLAATILAMAIFCTPSGAAFVTATNAHAILNQAAQNLGHTPPIASQVRAELSSSEAFMRGAPAAHAVASASARPTVVLHWLLAATPLGVDTSFVTANGMVREADAAALASARAAHHQEETGTTKP